MSDWTRIGESLGIHNLCLYDKLELPLHENSLFACCQYGGPLAIGSPGTSPNAWTIAIFMQNGVKIASIESSAVYRLFWSKCQKLIILNSNGRVLVYNALGVHLVTFNMGDVREPLAVGLVGAKAFSYGNETGLAVVSESKHIFAVNSVNSRVLWRIQNQQRESIQSLTCWTVLACAVRPTRVLLCHRNKFQLGIQEATINPCNFTWARKDGSYLQMVPDAKHGQLALLHDTSVLQLIDCADLELQLRVVRLDQCPTLVELLAWCGTNAICLKCGGPNEMTIYALDASQQTKAKAANDGANGEAAVPPNFTFLFPSPRNSPVFLSPIESDCVRAFTRSSAHLLQPVSASTSAVLGLTSNEPGSLLFDAQRKMEQKSHQAYEFVRSISAQQMPEAIEQCLEAAADHFDPRIQKQLLRAASIGIRRCDRPYDSDRFVHICRVLRVLNALRPMGVPLTHCQLNELSLPSIIDRLATLNHWPLAIKLCNFLNLTPQNGVFKVLGHWCLAMMGRHKERQREAEERHTHNQTEEGLAQRMVAKLAEYPTISYADVAEMASRQQLSTLATILLDLETDTARQVTVMLKLKQLDKALHKAALSQRPDLLLLVIRHLQNTLTSRDMELLLQKVPQALSIYQNEIRDEAPERLLALYEQSDDFVRQAIFHLKKAQQNQAENIFDSSKIVEHLGRAEKALRQMRDSTNAQLVAESAQLTVENAKREEKHNVPMVHLTVRETFLWAAAREEMALLEQLRRQHRLSEKQVFLWTAEGFARGAKWQQLEQYVKSKKSPLGYLPIIRLCAMQGNKNLAFRLMDRLNVYTEQVQAYLILGFEITVRKERTKREVKKAAMLAVEREDVQMLQNIKCRFPPSSQNWEEAKKLMDTLLQKGT